MRGGWLFAGDGGRGFWSGGHQQLAAAPRRRPTRSTTRRCCAAASASTRRRSSSPASGSPASRSRPTSCPTLDNGLTFVATLANPFPSGVQDPVGSSLGPNTFVGRQLDRFAYVDGVRNEQNARWAITVQRELPHQWLLGARLRRLARLRPDRRAERQHAAAPVPEHGAGARPGDDQLPHDERHQPVRRAAAGRRAEQRDDAAPAAAPAVAAVQRHPDLALRRLVALPRAPEPRRAAVRAGLHGAVRLHLLDVHRSQLHAELHRRRAGARPPPTPTCRTGSPSRASSSCRSASGRRWGANANGFVNALVGDWTVTAIASIQSGRPISFTDRARNLYFNGDLERAVGELLRATSSQPVFDISGFYFDDAAVQTNGVVDPVKQRNDQRIRLANNVRYFPHRLGNLRSQALNEWQMSFVKRVPHHAAHPRPDQHRAAERVQPDDLRGADHRSDQRELRQGHESVQPAAERADRVQAAVLNLLVTARRTRGHGGP